MYARNITGMWYDSLSFYDTQNCRQHNNIQNSSKLRIGLTTDSSDRYGLQKKYINCAYPVSICELF